MSFSLNRRRPFRTVEQVRQRHVSVLLAALRARPDHGAGSDPQELAKFLYDQGVRVRL